MKMIKINLTRDGLSNISRLITDSKHLSEILDGSRKFEGDGEDNCVWFIDTATNRHTHMLCLPSDKLQVLKFLFEVELKFITLSKCITFKNFKDTKKMLKNILKVIDNEIAKELV